MTPDCSPIPLKTSDDSLALTPQSIVHDSTRYLSISIDPSQMPSDYARQMLDNALAELMECSM